MLPHHDIGGSIRSSPDPPGVWQQRGYINKSMSGISFIIAAALADQIYRRITMLGSCTPRGLILSMLLLLSSSGESRPRVAHEGPLSRAENQRVQLVEAVKTGILSSLGMDGEPEPTRRASEQEMRRMFQLYREQLTEMRGNTSQSMKGISMSTVLLPATGDTFSEREESCRSSRTWLLSFCKDRLGEGRKVCLLKTSRVVIGRLQRQTNAIVLLLCAMKTSSL